MFFHSTGIGHVVSFHQMFAGMSVSCVFDYLPPSQKETDVDYFCLRELAIALRARQETTCVRCSV